MGLSNVCACWIEHILLASLSNCMSCVCVCVLLASLFQVTREMCVYASVELMDENPKHVD